MNCVWFLKQYYGSGKNLKFAHPKRVTSKTKKTSYLPQFFKNIIVNLIHAF